MSTVLVAGASQGLGLEMVRQYAREGSDVLATVRNPAAADALRALGSSVTVLSLDVDRVESIQALARELQGRPIDVVIANAGVMGGEVEPAQASADEWLSVLRTNTVGPVMLALALRPNLERGSQKKLVAISSLMGSIADNQSGGHIPYRTSKAALNMAWKSLSIDFARAGVISVVLHPGWVKTRMGGNAAPLEPTQSVAGMRATIEALTASHNGAFLRYDGSPLAW